MPVIQYCTSKTLGGLVKDNLKKRMVKIGAAEAEISWILGFGPKTLNTALPMMQHESVFH